MTLKHHRSWKHFVGYRNDELSVYKKRKRKLVPGRRTSDPVRQLPGLAYTVTVRAPFLEISILSLCAPGAPSPLRPRRFEAAHALTRPRTKSTFILWLILGLNSSYSFMNHLSQRPEGFLIKPKWSELMWQNNCSSGVHESYFCLRFVL